MSIEATRTVVEAFVAEGYGLDHVAEDAVFVNMTTGQEFRGHRAIERMLRDGYEVALDATTEVTNIVVADGAAAFEGLVEGTHRGTFAGVEPTNKNVRIPLCVTLAIRDGMIREAHIYLQVGAFLAQVGTLT